MTIDRRFLIEETISEVKSEVTDILEHLKRTRANFEYDIRDVMEVLPIMTEKDGPVPSSVANAIAEVLGKEAEFVVSPGTYDQKHISRIGHLHDCVAYGPGILDLAHRPDEFIVIEDMIESAKVMALSIDALLHPAS
jgi:succinyl-diaminopimelate desuccinylase